MGVIISNMDMPNSCSDCKCTFDNWTGETRCCLGAKCIDWDKLPKDCPLRPVDATFENIFTNCVNLDPVDISKWNIDVNKCSKFNNMFSECKSLDSLDLSEWSTSNIKKNNTNEY